MQQKHFYIYKITLTNKDHELYNHYYYGARITNKKPENDSYKGSSTMIRKSKYFDFFPNDYIKEIVKICKDENELYNSEKEIIGDLYLTDSNCLNMFRGGLGGRITWNKTSEELNDIYKKIKNSNKGKSHWSKHPEITKQKISEIHSGKKLSDETKEKISKSKTGKQRIKENFKDYSAYCKKISERLTGKKLSNETKEKISEKQKIYFSDETNKQKLSAAVKTAMNTPEIKEKCSLGGKIAGAKIWINKNKINKRISLDLLQKYTTDGWNRGRYGYKRNRS